MTSKTTNKFSSEVRARAVRMVLDHEGEHASRWAAISSIAAKIGCTAQIAAASLTDRFEGDGLKTAQSAAIHGRASSWSHRPN